MTKEQDKIKRWERKLCRERKSPEAIATSLCGYGYYDPNGVPKEAIYGLGHKTGSIWYRNNVWHNGTERPTKLPIIHVWYHGNRVACVRSHENIPLQEEIDDINFQTDDKWAYVEDLLPDIKEKEEP